jgi:hypothetical protein
MSENTPIEPLSLKELAEVLVKHHGFHEGLFDTAIEFQFALGQVGPTKESQMPGAMIGISRIGLARTDKPGPHSVDPANVNPAKKSRHKAEN